MHMGDYVHNSAVLERGVANGDATNVLIQEAS